MRPLVPPPLSCRAPWWAASGHLQTILGNYLPGEPPTHPSEPFRIQLADGDQLTGRHYPGESDALVLVFHGLGGDDQAHYVRRTIALARKLGHHVWTVNHRGCGEGRGLAKQPYHSGSGEDLGAAFAAARERHPNLRQLAIGYSLSANALLLNLGGGLRGPAAQPDAAIAVNPPVDLGACSDTIHRGLSRLYELRFIRRCRKAIHQRVEDGLIPDIYRTGPLMSLRQFDDAYTTKAAGFRDADDYYDQCSARSHLSKITIPTVILMAKDDPFIPWRHAAEAQPSPAVHLHFESRGGHMGYLSRDLPGHRWLPYAVEHYSRQLLDA
ncbi:alpha/beta hydrolase [Geothrix oryzae]|uniref:Alpha/beta hydrolase n=1 Tax=Geothrix oryzae TaxID=2927975 RepID=A0ABN6UYV1_9BACT|nr:alpha/beta fold hydrolase [Geothrix oryzae]BDU69460.1 alpha/beta hydrolase [Geothrix oryzae]